MRKTILFGLLAHLCVAVMLTPSSVLAVTPGSNLETQNIPVIPDSLEEQVSRYTEFRSAGLASWHPIKREVLISTRFADTAQLHLVKSAGAARQQLTFFKDSVMGGSFQPTHGEYLVFTKDIGGDENFQKFRYDFASGDITLLTDGKSRNTGGAWSHRGDRIAYQSNRRNKKDMDIYLMLPEKPGADRMLATMEGGGWSVVDWSYDDRQLLVQEYISVNESRLWLMNTESGEKTLLTDKAGTTEPVSYSGGSFSPDGQYVYTSMDKDSEFHRLARINLKTREPQYLTSHIKWDIDDFALSDDGKWLAYTSNEDGISVLHLMNTADCKHKDVQIPSGSVGSLQWHRNNVDLGFTLETARFPSDVYSLSVNDSQKVERWTFSETGGINTVNFSDAQPVHWKSFDGRTISGLLYKPAKKFTGKRPVMIDIHGGPEGQSTVGFLGRYNYYLNELGIALIFPNIRGSTGYGKTFAKLDNAEKREDSYKDINALLDWIAKQSELDPARVMVTGGSYGGHMALAVAANYGERIRCARDVVGPSNLVTFLERTESYRRDLRRVEYGDERDPKMRAFLEKTAPRNKANQIRVPLFVVQGKNDPRVPWQEAEDMVAAIRKNGTAVWYLMANDEGHGFRKKQNADYLFFSTIMFVKNFLLENTGKTETKKP